MFNYYDYEFKEGEKYPASLNGKPTWFVIEEREDDDWWFIQWEDGEQERASEADMRDWIKDAEEIEVYCDKCGEQILYRPGIRLCPIHYSEWLKESK